MRTFFITWYFTEGWKAAFGTLSGFIRALARRFNILGLSATLLSPWRKDVAPRNWLGFHPLRSLSRFFENGLTRFLGMLVRLATISAGLAAIGFAAITGVLFVSAALLAPILFAGGAIGWIGGADWGEPLLFLGVAGFALMTFGYLNRALPVLPDKSFSSVRRSSLFPRVLARLGLPPEGLPAGSLENEAALLALLKTQGMDQEDYVRALAIEEARIERHRADRRFWSWENLSRVTRIGKYWKYGYTTLLDRYALDLSRFDPTLYAHEDLVGRMDVLKNALVILQRPTDNSILLVGEAGTGKQTFVHYLARLIRENRLMGTDLDEMRVMALDLAEAIDGASASGQDPEPLVRHLLNQAAFAGNILLVIERLDRFLMPDSQGRSFAGVFAEYLALPAVRVIGTMDPAAYHRLVEREPSVLKHLEAIQFPETAPDETLAVLLNHFAAAEERRVLFTLPALEHIIKNAERIHWETPFPERALDLAEEVLTQAQALGAAGLITPAAVDAYLEQKSGIPRGEIKAEERAQLLNLESTLHARVIGQEEAVKQVAEALRKARAGFGNDKRPIGSFLFLGPTGVGKTETAKALAAAYFGDEEHMLRLDMSEFQTPEAVDRLIGSPGQGIEGKLSQAAQERPYGILLLDELDKAYPRALDLFLQILDEGFMTDGYGKKVNFRNMIIIATSNAGAVRLRELLAQNLDPRAIEEALIEHIIEQGLFRPEFLNRFDGVITFRPLQDAELVQVVGIKLAGLQSRLAEEKNIRLEFGAGLAEKIVERGYQPEFGARSLNRYMDDELEDHIAKAIIAGDLSSGGTIVLGPEMLENV